MSDLLRAAINVRARCQGLRVALDAAHALDWLDKEIELAKAALAADVRSPPPKELGESKKNQQNSRPPVRAVFEVRTFDGWWEITSPQIAGLFIANPDAELVFGDLLKSWRLLYELNGPAHVVEPPRAPGPSDLQGKLPGLLEALADTVRQLEHHKQTHEQWRDCEQSHRDANPKIGDSAFHAECVEDYETMISAVKYAAEFARAAVPKDQARPTSDTQGREPAISDEHDHKEKGEPPQEVQEDKQP
jgi:hypothetical protein